MMNVFTSSDLHYFHRNIIKYCDRPFDFNDENCVIDNAKLMLERHNRVVKKDDIWLCVGDLSAALRGRTDTLSNLIQSMNGIKILVRGNHDHLPDDFYKNAGFIDVVQYLAIGDTFICHYPCYEGEFNKGREINYIQALKKSGCTNIIHGHCHNKDPDTWAPDGYNRWNVCVDFKPNDYYPQEIKNPEIKNFLVDKCSISC